jgi:Ca2+-binding RTX toxin-like protein
MFFETLESRSLFSVSLAAGVLTVTGTSLNDAITITKNAAGQVSVNNDGSVSNFTWASVNKVVVNGLAGNDSIISQNSMTKPMLVHGGDGNDTIFGGGGNDSLYGDNGNDRIDGRNGNDDEHGGAGSDLADFSDRTVNLTITLDDVANDGGPGGHDNIHSDFEAVIGGSGNDAIVGNANTTEIVGNGGNDSLFGGASNAYIEGDAGNDVIVGGSGQGESDLYGGAGNDIIYGYGYKNWIDGGDGNDYINCHGTGFTHEYGDDGNDTMLGGSGQNDLHGGNGNDVMQANNTTEDLWEYGDAGNDILYGSSTTYSELHGGDGNDTLYGGGETEWLYGDAGDDRLYAGSGYMPQVFGGDGNDSLFGGPGNDYLSGDAGDDVIVSIGGGQNDHLHGGDGFDSFWCDAESTETIDDVSLVEALFGTVHRVSGFYNGASRELWGQNIPDPTDAGHTTNFASDPLFSSSGPSPDDIRQGIVGDCYFLATLSATAKTDAIRIRQSVVDLGDGTYAVQFWANGSPRFMRVDADLSTSSGYLVYASLGQQNSLWVPIMEKAFTYFRKGLNTYASISSGWMNEVFTDLNAPVVTTQWSGSWSSAGALLNYIQGELNASKAVTVGTPGTITAGCPCVASHAYMVDHVNYIHVYRVPTAFSPGGMISIPVSVTLRNPWGDNYGTGASDPTSAYVTISAADAFKNFVNVISAAV